MIEPVTMFETKNGKRFNTEKEAEEYIVDLVGTEFDGIFKKSKAEIRYRELYKLCLSLFGDYDKIVAIRDFLNSIV